jgi:hypothetical protein
MPGYFKMTGFMVDRPTYTEHALHKSLPGSHRTGNWHWIDEKDKHVIIQHPNNDTCIGLLSASK